MNFIAPDKSFTFSSWLACNEKLCYNITPLGFPRFMSERGNSNFLYHVHVI